jgi:hypothetical protein
MAVFTFLYLQRLPQKIWVLLSEDDPADMRAIAEKADRLIAMHVPQSHDACAAVAAEVPSEEPDMVAALQGLRAAGVRLPSGLSSSRWAGVSTSPREIRSRATSFALPCVFTMLSSASRPSTARRVASGWKTRPLGHSSGGSPQSPLLCNGQPLSTPFPH